jgi:hypothetical protein
MPGPSAPARAPSRPGWRVVGHVLAFALGWPAFSLWFAPKVLSANTIFHGLAPGAVRWGMLAALGMMWREVGAAVAVLCLLSLLAALLAGGLRPSVARARRQLGAGVAEAGLTAAALLCGVVLELPEALNHPALAALQGLTVVRAWVVVALGTAAAAGALGFLSRSRALALRRLASAAALAAVGFAAARTLPDGGRETAGSRGRIVLGLDSISEEDPLDPLRALAAEAGGTWYQRAVTPGLLTNAVWTSIVTSRLPSETGVFFTFQTPDWEKLPQSLPARAHAAGLGTCAYFSDQLTMHLGADLPFDRNRSGPRGWLQPATAALKDAGWFLPLVLAHLPAIPGARTPPNQGGTYTYSLARELSELLTCRVPGADALVLAHLDYLHQARYPGMADLGPGERARVRAATVGALVDESIHWQYPEKPGEPLKIYGWKLSHLQRTLAAVVARTQVLDPRLGNQLVLLSDHGRRVGLTPENFGEARYWHVLLVTFGVPPREASRPISLLEVPALLGLPAPGRAGPAAPVVEYTTVTTDEWKELLRGSKLLLNGRAELSPGVLAKAGARLSRFEPYAPAPQYVTAPALPAPEPSDPTLLRFGG